MDPFVLALAIGAFVLGFAAGAGWMWRLVGRAIGELEREIGWWERQQLRLRMRTQQPRSDDE